MAKIIISPKSSQPPARIVFVGDYDPDQAFVAVRFGDFEGRITAEAWYSIVNNSEVKIHPTASAESRRVILDFLRVMNHTGNAAINARRDSAP